MTRPQGGSPELHRNQIAQDSAPSMSRSLQQAGELQLYASLDKYLAVRREKGLILRSDFSYLIVSSWRRCKHSWELGLGRHWDLTEVRAHSWYKVRSYELVNPTFKISLLTG